MDNLIKIRSEFLNDGDASAAVEKISPHCYNIKILYNSADNGSTGYVENFEPGFYDYTSGLNAGWGANPFSSYNFEHTRSHNYLSSLWLGRNSSKTILEAGVSRDKYEFVKERLYSSGALSVN